jgi:hypothetical protein
MEDEIKDAELTNSPQNEDIIRLIFRRFQEQEVINKAVAERLKDLEVRATRATHSPHSATEVMDIEKFFNALLLAEKTGIDRNSKSDRSLDLSSKESQSTQSKVKPQTLGNKAPTTKEIWQRGDRAIATGAGSAFLGGIVAQLPGAIAGAVFGTLYGLFVVPKQTSRAEN